MEVAGGVLRRAAIGPGVGFPAVDFVADQYLPPSSVAVSAGPWKKKGRRESGRVSVGRGFADDGHLRYYASSSARCGGGWGKKREEREKERLERRRARLAKDLSKDLSELCAMGFGVEDEEVAAGEGRGKMIWEAAELLLAELNQLRAQEEETKKRRKEERATMNAAKMKACARGEDSSSSSESSSSESSDSECGEVVDMSSLKSAMPLLEVLSEKVAPPMLSLPTCDPLPQNQAGQQPVDQQIALKLGHEYLGACSTTSSSIEANAYCGKSAPAVNKPNKIEVCLGGKCKKSGALDLLAEFERQIGIDGAVVGCKCMGKCKQGPNVRVVASQDEGEGKGLKNPLCIGVGLEDVSTIVENFLQKQLTSV